jgi:hypothetical protein
LTSDFRLPTSDFRLSSSDFRLPSSVFRLPSSDIQLPTSVFRHQSSDIQLPTSVFRHPTSDFRLPTSNFRLPSSVFRLPSSDFLYGMPPFLNTRPKHGSGFPLYSVALNGASGVPLLSLMQNKYFNIKDLFQILFYPFVSFSN